MFQIVVVVLIWTGLAGGQTTYFNKTYDLSGTQYDGAISVLATDTGYFMVEFAADSSLERLIAIVFIDTLGNKIWEKKYSVPGSGLYPGIAGSFIPVSSGGFALAGSITYPSGYQDAVLFRFDDTGDTLWTRTIGVDTLYEITYQCKETADSGFIMIGATSDGSNPQMLLIKTDSLGNVQWQQTYAGYGFNVDLCDDGGYILGSQRCFGNNCQTHVVKVDSVGNIEWERMFGGPYNEQGAMVIQTADGGYIIAADTGHYLVGPVTTWKQLYLIRLDSNGNTIWNKAYGSVFPYNGFGQIQELADGSFIATGQAFITGLSIEGLEGIILKVNDSGDSLWLRQFHYCPIDTTIGEGYGTDYFRHVQPTNDGGYIAVGFEVGSTCTSGQDMWVVKMDSLGCDVPGCQNVGIPQLPISDVRIKVYPNPARGEFTVEGNYELPAVFELYDLTGRRVRGFIVSGSEFKVDVQGWKMGLYLYRLVDSGGGVSTGKVVIE